MNNKTTRHTGVCTQCGKVKEFKYRSHIRIFCGVKCANIYKWENTRKRAETTTIMCEYCNKPFVKNVAFIRQHPETKFCSRECSGKNSMRGENRNCKKCGAIFYTIRHGSKYCSKACSSKHNGSGTRLYKIWENMRSRCNNKNATYYSRYGGRGISICKEWDEFEVFMKWANSNGYAINLSIDRIDNDGNYEPQNCRWSTQNIQARNSTRIRITNTSGYRGVNIHGERWVASITVNYKRIHIGVFDDIHLAVKARDNYIIKHNLSHTRNLTEDTKTCMEVS